MQITCVSIGLSIFVRNNYEDSCIRFETTPNQLVKSAVIVFVKIQFNYIPSSMNRTLNGKFPAKQGRNEEE